jgi:hypothetical protein
LAASNSRGCKQQQLHNNNSRDARNRKDVSNSRDARNSRGRKQQQ